MKMSIGKPFLSGMSKVHPFFFVNLFKTPRYTIQFLEDFCFWYIKYMLLNFTIRARDSSAVPIHDIKILKNMRKFSHRFNATGRKTEF